ncbi:hypothetical protein OG749_46095 (plasmid) [Streptomyces nojiriensis]|uniref:hypothetical protein n=1 Tax=Streptomyces nojiriensis TaxID=66374 RepID=UPI002E1921EC
MPSCIPSATPHALPASGPVEVPGQRLGHTQRIVFSISVMLLGTGLFVTGTPMTDVFMLLSGCGLISATTLAVAAGGRRLAQVLIEAAVQAATSK